MKSLFLAHNLQLTQFAFTLAETLVVMGIIGVVAALTIPNLNQSTGDREKVAKVKKVYANLTDAYGRATAVYGPIDTWFVNDTDEKAYTKRFADRMTEFMKISKDCGSTPNGCFASTIFFGEIVPIEEGLLTHISNSYSKNYLLADGIAISFESYNHFGTSWFTGYNSISMIAVDIDGQKGPSEYGKDIFLFGIYENSGLIPIRLADEARNYGAVELEEPSGESFAITGATAWVIQNGNLDYLKCPDELSWNGQTTCK